MGVGWCECSESQCGGGGGGAVTWHVAVMCSSVDADWSKARGPGANSKAPTEQMGDLGRLTWCCALISGFCLC
jgi:hypothetical protein